MTYIVSIDFTNSEKERNKFPFFIIPKYLITLAILANCFELAWSSLLYIGHIP